MSLITAACYSDGVAESLHGGSWDVVVNAVFETAHGKREEFYTKGVDAAAKLAQVRSCVICCRQHAPPANMPTRALQGALRIGAKKYIFVSTAQV